MPTDFPPLPNTTAHLKHPDLHAPWSQWSEDQVLHLIIPYCNPWRWRNTREIANDTIRHFRSAANVVVHVVEVAFGDRPHELTGSDPNDIQLRTDCEMFVKEHSINIAAARINAPYVGYTDADFTFSRHDWALEAIHLLQHYQWTQLFSTYADLTAETATSWMGHRPYRLNTTMAWNYLHQREFFDNQTRRSLNNPGYFQLRKEKGFPFGFWPGAPGGAWAWRQSAFSTTGGMLDSCVLGSADWHMACGLMQLRDNHAEMQTGLDHYIRAIREWQRKAAKLEANIGCVDNFAVHKWHGSKTLRGYGERPAILKQHAFNPYEDITKDWQGLPRWTGNKPRLRDDVRRLFLSRNEDSTQLLDAQRPLV